MNWFVSCLQRYAVWTGRSGRQEYWHYAGIYLLVTVVVAMLDAIVGRPMAARGSSVGPLQGLFTLAVLVPTLGVCIRRLHDTNRSGWWLLIGMVPVLGMLVLLVFSALAGDRGSNRFGPPPPTMP